MRADADGFEDEATRIHPQVEDHAPCAELLALSQRFLDPFGGTTGELGQANPEDVLRQHGPGDRVHLDPGSGDGYLVGGFLTFMAQLEGDIGPLLATDEVADLFRVVKLGGVNAVNRYNLVARLDTGFERRRALNRHDHDRW